MNNKPRDLYNDNITDVSSIEDLEGKETLNLLSKSDSTLQFEFANDFWKIEEGVLYQYPDFLSMLKDKQGKKVYDSQNPQAEDNTLYGKVIKETIENASSFEALPNITLKERDNYIKRANKSVDGGVRMSFSLDKEKIQKNTRNVEEITNKALESIDKQETKPVLDLVKLSIKALAFLFMFSKKSMMEYKKDKLIDSIIKGLDDNKLDINKILSDRELNQKIPELREILSRYKEQYIPIDVKSQRESITKILGDEQVINVADKLSENEIFKEQLADKFSIEITKRLDESLPQGYDDKMIQLYSESGSTNPLDFSKELLLKNLEEIYQKDKHITAQEYTLSVAYLAQMINTDENKNLLAETLVQTSIDQQKTDTKMFSVIENIVHQCIKNELDLTQQQQYKR